MLMYRMKPGSKVSAAILATIGLTVGSILLTVQASADTNQAVIDSLSELEKQAVILVQNPVQLKKGYTSLEESLRIAKEQNFDLREAKQLIERERGVRLSARSESLPQINVTGEFRQVDPDSLPSFGGSTFGSDNSWNSNIEVSQLLYAGGRASSKRTQADFLLDAAQLEYDTRLNSMIKDVKQAFYDVLLARARIDVQLDSVKLLKEELELERNKLDAGTVSNFNVLRAEVELANARTPLIRARNDLRLALEDLSIVLGISHGKPKAVAPALKVIGALTFEDRPLDLPVAIEQAYEKRPELKRLDILVKARDEGIAISEAEYFPEISVYAGYAAESSPFVSSLGEVDQGWVAGVRTKWNIFSGRDTTGKIRQAHADKSIAQVALERTRQNIEIEVRRALSRMVEARELVVASEKVIEQAEESFRLAKARLDAGSGRQIDVLDTQVALTEARTNNIEALYAYRVSLAELDRSIGIF